MLMEWWIWGLLKEALRKEKFVSVLGTDLFDGVLDANKVYVCSEISHIAINGFNQSEKRV